MLKLKTDWTQYLHRLRRREIEIIFRHCPPNAFRRGLELGAGDAFQSDLLARYVETLVVTDFTPRILEHPNTVQRSHRVCDAEEVAQAFAPGEFDFVFSSNMMEHVPHPDRALAGVHQVLRDDGIAIHVMPSPLWKFCQMAGFHLDAVLTRLERYSAGKLPQFNGDSAAAASADDNNLKLARSYGRLRRLLWPVPHGVSAKNWQEFFVFRREYWRKQLEAAGFEVITVLRGPVSSGYGFGFDGARALLEQMGAASEFVYVTQKKGCSSKAAAYFRNQGGAKGGAA
ncbi:MAG TPA: class I SAM-dependent methyltransferase [bacterium]|nr:class I SAM-dependent methyltransferase [bacterium]